MTSKILLFDIDYTLFDTTKFKNLIADTLLSYVPTTNLSVLDGVYYEVRKFGSFDPKLFAKLFKSRHKEEIVEEEIEHLWFDNEIIKQAIYPEVIHTLQHLQKLQSVVLGIFSSGKTEFQLQKISSLSDFFSSEHVHIADFKEETLSDLMRGYSNENVVLIDDFIDILYKGKKLKNDLQTVWMKRGKFAEKAEIPDGFTPDATITTLSDIIDIIVPNLTNSQ